MARAIFISYRRDDTEGEAGRLFDDLSRSLGENSVFMDVTAINPGVDFRKAIDDNVATCGALLAVIGPSWATITDSSGSRRLDDPDDFVRLEIASALARDVAVIPVLVHEAKMPHPDQLPENLKDLAFRNSVELSHTRWASDVDLLTKALAPYVAPSSGIDTKPVHATVPVQLPPPTAPAPSTDSTRRPNLPLILVTVVAAALALGFVAYKIFHSATVPTPGPSPVVVNPTPSSDNSNSVPANSSSFLGDWINPAPAGRNGIYSIEIEMAVNHLSVHAWGNCTPKPCNWGKAPATFHDGQLWAEWDLGQVVPGEKFGRSVTAAMQPSNDKLIVNVTNFHTKRPIDQRQFTFVKKQ